MIERTDILSMEYLKKTQFTGCHQGMRYRLEGAADSEGAKKLLCTVWPEPYSFGHTPEEERESAEFVFGEEGVAEAVAWMNGRLSEERARWECAARRWEERR